MIYDFEIEFDVKIIFSVWRKIILILSETWRSGMRKRRVQSVALKNRIRRKTQRIRMSDVIYLTNGKNRPQVNECYLCRHKALLLAPRGGGLLSKKGIWGI